MKEYVVGIDIGGTKTAIVLAPHINTDLQIDIEQFFIDREAFKTPVGEEASLAIPLIIETIYSVLKRNSLSKDEVRCIGISCGGPINSKKGIILHPPNLFNWHNVHIVDLLSTEFGVQVKLQNDANACALAEWIFGAGKGTKNMVFLTMGTGMGAGFIFNEQLYSGTNDMAGEIGHVRISDNGPVGFGKEGSFEGFCGGSGIAQVASSKALERLQMGLPVSYCNAFEQISSISAQTTAEAASKGDVTAIETYSKVGRYLGKGISILIDLLNPERIIIGSIYFRSKDLLEKPMLEEIEKEALDLSRTVCEVLPCKLGNRIGDFGAISVALYNKEL